MYTFRTNLCAWHIHQNISKCVNSHGSDQTTWKSWSQARETWSQFNMECIPRLKITRYVFTKYLSHNFKQPWLPRSKPKLFVSRYMRSSTRQYLSDIEYFATQNAYHHRIIWLSKQTGITILSEVTIKPSSGLKNVTKWHLTCGTKKAVTLLNELED